MRFLLPTLSLIFTCSLWAAKGLNHPVATIKDAITADYRWARNTYKAIVTNFPPSEYLYVGIGRSPTITIAFLQAQLGLDAALNLPLSGMSEFAPEPTQSTVFSRLKNQKEQKEIYNPAQVERLRKHLQDFLPTHKKIGGRKVLFIDWADSGLTIRNFQRELNSYLQAHSPNTALNYQILALADSEKYSKNFISHPDISYLPLDEMTGEMFVTRSYRKLAEFEQFDVRLTTDLKPKKLEDVNSGKNENFKQLVNALRAKQLTDHNLKAFLIKSGLNSELELTFWDQVKITCDKLLRI